jgi:hypothetical protein
MVLSPFLRVQHPTKSLLDAANPPTGRVTLGVRGKFNWRTISRGPSGLHGLYRAFLLWAERPAGLLLMSLELLLKGIGGYCRNLEE